MRLCEVNAQILFYSFTQRIGTLSLEMLKFRTYRLYTVMRGSVNSQGIVEQNSFKGIVAVTSCVAKVLVKRQKERFRMPSKALKNSILKSCITGKTVSS